MTPELWKMYRQLSQDERMDSAGQINTIQATAAILAGYSPVLCVGCGDGTELSFFPGATGFTLNAGALLPAARQRHDVVVGDMHALPFRDGTFDAIFCKDCFEHALAPSIALSELCRVVRRAVLLVTPDEYWECSPKHPLTPTVRQISVMAWKLGWDTQVSDLECGSSMDALTRGEVEYTLHMCLLTRKP